MEITKMQANQLKINSNLSSLLFEISWSDSEDTIRCESTSPSAIGADIVVIVVERSLQPKFFKLLLIKIQRRSSQNVLFIKPCN